MLTFPSKSPPYTTFPSFAVQASRKSCWYSRPRSRVARRRQSELNGSFSTRDELTMKPNVPYLSTN
jgi:hypothetical protein